MKRSDVGITPRYYRRCTASFISSNVERIGAKSSNISFPPEYFLGFAPIFYPFSWLYSSYLRARDYGVGAKFYISITGPNNKKI